MSKKITLKLKYLKEKTKKCFLFLKKIAIILITLDSQNLKKISNANLLKFYK